MCCVHMCGINLKEFAVGLRTLHSLVYATVGRNAVIQIEVFALSNLRFDAECMAPMDVMCVAPNFI